MKTLTLIVMGIILIVLASYAAVSYESNSYKLKTFVIDGNKENVKTNYPNTQTNCPNIEKNYLNTKKNYHNIKSQDSGIKTFTIPHPLSGKAMLIHTKILTQDARKRNIMYQQRDEEIERCIKKITKNWKRTYYKTSYNKYYNEEEEKWMHEDWSPFYEEQKEFYGYDEDEDWKLKWELKNKALDRKKIC